MSYDRELWSELSEEWASQPRTSPTSSVALPTYSGTNRFPKKDLHRGSRIPRSTTHPRHTRSSRLSAENSHTSPRTTSKLAGAALSIRDTNIINSTLHSSPPLTGKLQPSELSMPSHHSKIESARSVVKYDHKAKRRSPAGHGETPTSVDPTWKELALRKQDLFSPLDLENVFQQATNHKAQGPVVPSTEPNSLLPTPILWRMPQSPSVNGTHVHADHTSVRRARAADMQARDDHEATASASDSKLAASLEEPTLALIKEESLHEGSQDYRRIHQSVTPIGHVAISEAALRERSAPNSPSEGSLHNSLKRAEKHGNESNLRPRETNVDAGNLSTLSSQDSHSGIASGSVSATSGFSPVFISKHNTVNGHVDYNAFDPDQLPQISEYVNCTRGEQSDSGLFSQSALSPSISHAQIPSDSVVPSDSVSQAHSDYRQVKSSSRPVHGMSADSAEGLALVNASKDSGGPEQNCALKPSTSLVPMHQQPSTADGPSRLTQQCRTSPLGWPHNEPSKEAVIVLADDASSDTQAVDTTSCAATGFEAKTAMSTAGSDNQLVAPDDLHHASDVSQATALVQSNNQSSSTNLTRPRQEQLHMFVGKKRKDARSDEKHCMSDASIVTQRDILRPRNPTPGQAFRSLSHVGHGTGGTFEQAPTCNVIATNASSVLIPTRSREAGQIRALASEVATFRMHSRVTQATGARKQSVSTQDYIDEAMKIMDLIRARKNVNSDLPSSDITTVLGEEAEPNDQGSHENSRPPSRDGPVNGWRSNAFEHVDSNLLEHLRKYEETGDESFLFNSIVRTAKISEEVEDGYGNAAHCTNGPHDFRVESSTSTCHYVEDAEAVPDVADTQPTSRSTGSSTRTVQTTSPQGTRNMARIAPEAASHLIQDEEAGMRFDTQKQAWVRQRSRKELGPANQPSSSVGTEDDSLMRIPDLSVNEDENSVKPQLSSQSGNLQVLKVDPSACPSVSHTVSPTNLVETSAHSFGNADPAHNSVSTDVIGSPRKLPYEPSEEDNLDLQVTAEVDNATDHARLFIKSPNRIREQTVFFSSPPVSRSWTAKQWTDATSPLPQNVRSDLQHDTESSQLVPWGPLDKTHVSESVSSISRMHCNMPQDEASERREISYLERRPDGRTMSLSLSISTPLPKHRRCYGDLRHQSFLRSLSPLSEFSQHRQRDQNQLDVVSKPLVVFEQYDGHLTARSSMVVKTLIEKLTDAEPNEPYWDYMPVADLSGRGLEALFALDSLCPRLERLDASENNIKHLEGAPNTLRHIRLCNNSISNITSWDGLQNLQYLDISANQLTSLEAIASLTHLRELKADDNIISTLDSILDLDGLIRLKVRGNKLCKVDFTGAQLKRLEHLDLSDNQITDVYGLAAMPQLCSLKISHNLLPCFPSSDSPANDQDQITVRKLLRLDVSYNQLQRLNIGHLPRLKSLHADGNYLDRIDGITNWSRLDSLYLRNQNLDTNISFARLDQFARLTHLHLSGTRLEPMLSMTLPFLRLRTLDVSFTGLQALPSDFGLLTPALQVLNLNANRLRDLRPLDGAPGLRILLAASNRIQRLRTLVRVLERLTSLRGGSLEEVDFRNNPLCTGFYPPGSRLKPQLNCMVRMSAELKHDGAAEVSEDSDSDDDDEVASRLSQTLAPIDRSADEQYISRLDEDTRLKRRVYELLLTAKCQKLIKVDGLSFDKMRVERKDDVWNTLIGKGVLEPTLATRKPVI